MWAGKDVENRTWPTRYRGPLFVHQGKGLDKAALQFAPLRRMVGEIGDHRVDEQAVIFGWVQLVDCHEQAAGCCESPWGLPDQWHWVLSEPQPLRATVAVPRGALGLWRPDPALLGSIRACV
jgi:hypothetical protein